MTTSYEAIAEENRRRYGTDIGRIGPMLLADRYDDRGWRNVATETSPAAVGGADDGKTIDQDGLDGR